MPAKDIRSPYDGQFETLDDLSEAVYYNRWIFSLMAPYLGKRVIEVGCGIGNITKLLGDGRRVLGLDIHPRYLSFAKKRLARQKNISFQSIKLNENFKTFHKFKADTIVCSNVLEHIENDRWFLNNCFAALPKGGRLLIFVPALPILYGSMDKTYGHFRRYSKSDLENKIRRTGFFISQCRYLNLLGIFGWWLNGKVFHKKVVPKGQLLLYDKIVRVVMQIERWLPKPIGLSLFCVGEKNN